MHGKRFRYYSNETGLSYIGEGAKIDRVKILSSSAKPVVEVVLADGKSEPIYMEDIKKAFFALVDVKEFAHWGSDEESIGRKFDSRLEMDGAEFLNCCLRGRVFFNMTCTTPHQGFGGFCGLTREGKVMEKRMFVKLGCHKFCANEVATF